MAKLNKNVIIITADEMRADACGFGGNPDCRTPHLDRIASSSLTFENHFAVFPKCVPSRISMLTGRYSHTEGRRTVMEPDHLRLGEANLVTHLREKHGYEAAVFGLNHTWQKEIFFDAKGSNSVVDYHSFSSEQLESIALKSMPSEELHVSKTKATALYDLIDGGCEGRERNDFYDSNRMDQALYYLEELRDPKKPFYLQINFSKPHPPYKIHEPFYSMYDRNRIKPFPYNLPDPVPYYQISQREHRIGLEAPEEWYREIQAVYYGMCTYIDAEVGRLVSYLDKEEMWDDVIFVFTSDHGDYAGQFGLIEKWDTDLRDCLLKVPFLIKAPDLPGALRIDALTSHVDFPATILSLIAGAQVETAWPSHGTSLWAEIWDGASRKAIYAEGGHEKSMRQNFNSELFFTRNGITRKAVDGKQHVYQHNPDSMAKAKMVRTKRWKLVVREVGEDELFDLKNDPYEMINLHGAEGTKDTVLELQRLLLDWCMATDPDTPVHSLVGA